MIELRLAGGRLDRTVDVAEAFALAVQGVVEGVGTRSGRVRFVRWLTDSARPVPEEDALDQFARRSTSVVVPTNMGVFKELIGQAEVAQDLYGKRVVRSSGGVVGFVYSHCLLRGAGV